MPHQIISLGHRLLHYTNWCTNYFQFGKQMSAILELLLRPYHSNRRTIPDQATKFRPNRATRCGVMTSYTISRWRQRWLNTTSGLVFDDFTLIRGPKSIRISSTYLNPELRYNYFRFWKTNVPITEMFFWLLLRYSNRRAVLHQTIKFRPNRNTRSDGMTS